MSDDICAVINCHNEAKAHACPYDGARHFHGMIHYDCGYPVSSLKFREGWHLICDEHYAVCCEERVALIQTNRIIREVGGAV